MADDVVVLTPQADRVRRPWRAAAAALVAIGLSFIPATRAVAAKVEPCVFGAETTPCQLSDGPVQWFWSSNQKITSCVPPPEEVPDDVTSRVPPPCGTVGVTGGVYSNAAGVASPITSGHIGVAMKDGQPDMRGYVKFDTGVLPPNIEFSSFKITLTVSQPNADHTQRHRDVNGKVPATAGQNRAKILACLAAEPWGAMTLDGGDPPYSTKVDQSKVDPSDPDPNDGISTEKNEPAVDCGLNATGQPSPNGERWTFEIAHIANEWAAGRRFNEGVALIPAPQGVGDTWTIEFHGPQLTVRETVCPVPGGACPVEPPDPTESDKVVWINKAEANLAVVEWAPRPEEDQPPVVSPPPVQPVQPPTLPPFPSAGNPTGQTPTTVTPPPTIVGPGARPVAGKETGFWWMMFPLGAIGLGLYSSAIGSEGTGAKAGNRVASVLRRRRLNGVEGVATPEQ